MTSGRKWSQPSLAASLKTSEEESFLDPESSDDFWLSAIYREGQETQENVSFFLYKYLHVEIALLKTVFSLIFQ